MMRIALSVLALTSIAAPLLIAGMTDTPAPTAAPSVAISQAQGADIAAGHGLSAVSSVALSNGDWRVEGETADGRQAALTISAETGRAMGASWSLHPLRRLDP